MGLAPRFWSSARGSLSTFALSLLRADRADESSGREPEFENLAPGQLRPERIVELALKDELWAVKRREEREREEARRVAGAKRAERGPKL